MPDKDDHPGSGIDQPPKKGALRKFVERLTGQETKNQTVRAKTTEKAAGPSPVPPL